MNNLSLINIMQGDPEFGKRLSRKTQEVKQDQQNLLDAAAEYGRQYEQEILEGTRNRANLLTEGKFMGLSEDEVMRKHKRFIPTVYTPVLNLLYFMFRETEGHDKPQYSRRDEIDRALVSAGQLYHEEGERDLSSSELSALIDQKLKELHEQSLMDENRRKVNDEFLSEEREKSLLKDTPDMVNFLYGEITLEVFNKIKKLKALSKSPNDQEAFQAYRKALELCKEHNIEFDRIPCYVDKIS